MVPYIGSMQIKENQLTCKLGPLHDLEFCFVCQVFFAERTIINVYMYYMILKLQGVEMEYQKTTQGVKMF